VNFIVVTGCVVWSANFFAQFFISSYNPDPSINSVFGSIIGIALALSRRSESPALKKEDS
jgi:hypothetical protein